MFSLLKLTLCFLKISEDAWQLVLQFPEAFIPSAKYFSLLYQTDILLQEGRLQFFLKLFKFVVDINHIKFVADGIKNISTEAYESFQGCFCFCIPKLF